MSSAGRKTKKKKLDLVGFLRLLKKADRKWRVWAGNDYTGEIRCRKGDCPILAVARMLELPVMYSNAYYDDAARELGMSTALAERIVGAADHDDWAKFMPLRKKLLAACGIKEPK